MLNENDVIEAVCVDLAQKGWAIQSRCDTSSKGVDIVATQDNRRLLVEAKGATSSKVGTGRFKEGFNLSQARTHVSVAIYKSMTLLGAAQPGDVIAIAVPKDANHQRLIEPIGASLAALSVSVIWVDEIGHVTWQP